MTAIIAMAALAVLVLGGRSTAQPLCPGDFNIDDSVTVDEIVLAVNAALSGCPPPRGCPQAFDEPTPSRTNCYFVGRWHPLCGSSDLEAFFVSDGVDVVVGIFDPDVDFFAEVVSPGFAVLYAWQVPDTPGEEPVAVDGEVLLSDPPRVALTVSPFEVPFSISECNFERYEGRFAEVLTSSALASGTAAAGGRVAARAAAARERLQAMGRNGILKRLKHRTERGREESRLPRSTAATTPRPLVRREAR